MIRLFCIFALAAGLTGCIVAPPYATGYGYAPAPAYESGPGYYGYAPGYYAAPAIDVGIGFGGYYGGGHGGHGGHER
ncbi:hypothetical protein AYM40_30580 [Paraburkholderia phytofirmans OLGA172]|jgi:hypothetical protein|uniref:Lipoprotein n=1 Tax=Paraburkholderia phytofirmans OLGA172 TaxID=1417228 RepID=A0A160FUS3_9BURK|nr:hypothetical protein [Paraburkholderia phytofirmans]ANB76548.1 hypothetical protein AYM40_30580 [Paraburkholderia phytofirmans OLGA172]